MPVATADAASTAPSAAAAALHAATTPPLQPFSTHQPTGPSSPLVHSFFDKSTSTWTYLVVDPSSGHAAIIDSVLEYDCASSTVGMESVKGLLAFVREKGYQIEKIMETHVHADHLTGAHVLKQLLGRNTPVCIGSKVQEVQNRFAPVYGFQNKDFTEVFDIFLHDDETFKLGQLEGRSLSLPGHTPDSMGIMIGDSLFAGDSIFLPDVGTARVDFPGGSARALYASIQRILHLGENVRVFSGHDYPPNRDPRCVSTVSEQSHSNKHVGVGSTLESFTTFREARDATLGSPKLLHASLQVNLRGGRMPPEDEEGRRWIRLPLTGEAVGV